MLVTISLFCWLFFLLFFNYDRCRYRNCLLLFISLCSTVPALCSLAGENATRVFYFCMILFCIALLIVPVFLIHNGILMMKREGRSLSNMLSLLLGLVIGFGEVSTFLFLLWVQNSGGQGSDETISEAEAMSRYMLDKGIPEYRIIKEDHSTTTMENLENCKKIIDSMEGRKYTTLVTSNYHVYRALRYCRKIGLECTGIGSHVAFYYWPSALIREFVAIHNEKKHFLLFIAGWILWIIMPMLYALHTI